MSTSTAPLAATLLATILAVVTGCGFEPRVPVPRHELNAAAIDANRDLAADPASQDQLRGTLEMLFGTPQHPGYLLLADWIDEEFDPNAGAFRLSDEDFEELKRDNAARFAREIAAICAGRLDDVQEPRFAGDLWRRFEELRSAAPADLDEPLDANDPDGLSWREELIYAFEGYYPDLATTAEFYRQQCQHCHGVSGGANGSTAEFLSPRPRDYRKGIFKFTALKGKVRPRHHDLYRVLTDGIYTTAMPSFRRFSNAQLHGLADYVELLAKRGETELLLITDYDPEVGLGGIEKIQETYEFVLDRWEGVDENLIAYEGEIPESTPERIEKGRQLFVGAAGAGANCASCHGDDGRGIGPSAKESDPLTGQLVWVKDDWGNEIQPRNLSRGIYRFGRRPIDIYRRIYAGINGTPMPEHIGMQITEQDGSTRPLDEEDLWNLVHFVRSLSARPLAAAHDSGAHGGAHGGAGSGLGGGAGGR